MQPYPILLYLQIILHRQSALIAAEAQCLSDSSNEMTVFTLLKPNDQARDSALPRPEPNVLRESISLCIYRTIEQEIQIRCSSTAP
jgi:hypothetical protein